MKAHAKSGTFTTLNMDKGFLSGLILHSCWMLVFFNTTVPVFLRVVSV